MLSERKNFVSFEVGSELNLDHSSPTNEAVTAGTVKRDKMNPVVVLASVISSLGGILFGYDIGIISAAILHIRDEFKLDSLMQEVVTSSVLLGAFLASLVAGSMVDYFGRRASILCTSLLFLIGSAIVVFGLNLIMIIVGRLVVGFGVALSTAAECTYISEISPPRWRGLLVSLNEFGITIGFLLAYVFGFLFISYEQGWRYMFGIAAIPAVVQLFGIPFLPPSPHFQVLKGKDEQAAKTIARLYNTADAQSVVEQIKLSLQESKSSKLRDIFSSKDSMRYRMLIGIALVLLQQFTGNSCILYYAPMIFQRFGYCSNSSATLVSISLGAIKVVTAGIALALVDRYGRRSFLCSGSTIMGISIFVLGVVTASTKPIVFSPLATIVGTGTGIVVNEPWSNFSDEYHFNENNNWTSSLSLNPSLSEVNLTNSSSDVGEETCVIGDDSLTIRVVSVIALMAYICGYQFSFGIGTWLVLSEIFPTAVRGRSVSIATSVYWASNMFITVSFFSLIECIGISALFIIYAGVCFVAAIFIFIFVPETKQKTLEEISLNLSSGPQISLPCQRRKSFNCAFTDRTRIRPSLYASYQSNRDSNDAFHVLNSARIK